VENAVFIGCSLAKITAKFPWATIDTREKGNEFFDGDWFPIAQFNWLIVRLSTLFWKLSLVISFRHLS
jgi:hypothetical protein